MINQPPAKPATPWPPPVIDNTLDKSGVIQEPYLGSGQTGLSDIIISFAQFADDIPMWGRNPRLRDRKLREFWPTESILSGALFTTISKYVSFSWSLEGPPQTVRQIQNALHNSDQGRGWESLIIKHLLDLFTQDNGAFLEIARQDNTNPNSPFVQLNHLDSNSCYRTGRTDYPVIYDDLFGKRHYMPWWSVIENAEFPSPIETAYGAQYCCVSRLLAFAKIMKDVFTFKNEKVAGRNYRSVHLVSGILNKTLNDVIAQHGEMLDNKGLLRYATPAIIAAVDPTSTISHAQIDLAGLPDGFDFDSEMRWYINEFALAFGGDYQDYGPLPGHNLGTAQQSQVLHQKGKGKGPALFMALLGNKLNFHGIMPNSVWFKFGEQDLAEQAAQAELSKMRAAERAERIKSGEITTEVAVQMALDAGDLKPEYLPLLNTIAVSKITQQPGSIPEQAGNANQAET